jgi:ADP-heptose:LPS heptosyltransferase
MATVLFLAPDDLGETVLATGALAHVMADADTLEVSASAEARPLFRALAGTMWLPTPLPWHFGITTRLAGKTYDVVLDARSGFAERLAPGRRRIAPRAGAIVRHRVEDWADALGAPRALAPKLSLDETARRAADAIAPSGPLLVLAPGGVTRAKRWPAERFAAVARRLVTGPLAEASVVVLSAAARDASFAAAITASLDADGVAARDPGASLDLLAAAALLERATLCIGNDNALCHIAAAAGAPTLTLFGPTDERVRAPWGSRARTLRGAALEGVAALLSLDAGAAMETLSIDAVEAAALELLHAGGLR